MSGIEESWRILITDDTPSIHEDIKKILLRRESTLGSTELKALENALFDQPDPARSAPASSGSEATKSLADGVPAYQIDSAYQGQEALEFVRASMREQKPYAMVFMDMRMPPGWDGLETIQKIWAEDPALQIVICSAYSDYAWDDILDKLGSTDRLLFLKKPFEAVEVQQMALALTKKWNLALRNRHYIENLEELVEERTNEIKVAMERVRIEGERAISKAVQKDLFPPETFQSRNLLVRSHYRYASMCGGDWLGLFEIGDKVAIMIGDATGHGIDSAFLAVAARSCFASIHKVAQEHPEFALSPRLILEYANRAIYETSHGATMMTFFAGLLDAGSGTLTYANAGHNPPWLFQRKSDGKYEAQSLLSEAPRLGEAPVLSKNQENAIEARAGDLLFLYSDGLTEALSPRGIAFGKRRARQAIEPQLAAGPEAVVQSILSHLGQHIGESPLDDDLTLAAALIR